MADDKTPKNPLLEESQGAERKSKFLILAARREGGQMAVIDFADSQTAADSNAKLLVKTGFKTAEVYTRTAAFEKK